jgi:hypothetical protein
VRVAGLITALLALGAAKVAAHDGRAVEPP